MKDGKTKALQRVREARLANALIIDGAESRRISARAARNIPNIDVLPIQGINVYDILRRQKLVLTKAARRSVGGAVQMSTSDPRHYDVILAPVITEKATIASEHNQVIFKVAAPRPSRRSRKRWRSCST